MFEHDPGNESSITKAVSAVSYWNCDFYEGNGDQNNFFHATSSEVLESEYLEIESATSNKAVNLRKPQ